MTQKNCEIRDQISVAWHKVRTGRRRNFLGFLSDDHLRAFGAGKDILQDTGEALMVHRENDFSADPHVAYIKFWGVMQAICIQQDAIFELNNAIFNKRLKHSDMGKGWQDIRNWRHLTTGHPARKERGEQNPARCVSGRDIKTYEHIKLQFHSGGPTYLETLSLGDKIDAYELEAVKLLEKQEAGLKAMLS